MKLSTQILLTSKFFNLIVMEKNPDLLEAFEIKMISSVSLLINRHINRSPLFDIPQGSYLTPLKDSPLIILIIAS